MALTWYSYFKGNIGLNRFFCSVLVYKRIMHKMIYWQKNILAFMTLISGSLEYEESEEIPKG